MFERLTVTLQMKGKPVHLQIWDTAGGCAGLGAGRGGGGTPDAQEPSPTPFLLDQGGQRISQEQVLAEIRGPPQEPESSLLLRLLPPPTQGSPLCPGDQRSPELFALEGGLFWPPK